uniref:Ubiquitin-like protease family profile domain-containing protein n=2 Tax=Podospora anserina TaxID=2587412 RepID=A0A090D8Y5_PODAN|nr:hypothetical protein [Podospora anserina]CDP30653.1 Putative protein of unknown function encoded in transposon Grenouille [Podospora anserina S mat+]
MILPYKPGRQQRTKTHRRPSSLFNSPFQKNSSLPSRQPSDHRSHHTLLPLNSHRTMSSTLFTKSIHDMSWEEFTATKKFGPPNDLVKEIIRKARLQGIDRVYGSGPPRGIFLPQGDDTLWPVRFGLNLVADPGDHVVGRRPDWINTTFVEQFSIDTIKYLFPGLRITTPPDRTHIYGIHVASLTCAMYDLQGQLEAKQWLTSSVLTCALRYSLQGILERCIWIPGEPLNPVMMKSSMRFFLPNDNHNAFDRRYWVLPIHVNNGSHWAVGIYDVATGILVYMDSSKDWKGYQANAISCLVSYIRHAFHCSLDVKVRRPACGEQGGAWECGLWVLEHCRTYFQGGVSYGEEEDLTVVKAWRGDRCYRDCKTVGVAGKKMMRLWMAYVKRSLGCEPDQRVRDKKWRRRGLEDLMDAEGFNLPSTLSSPFKSPPIPRFASLPGSPLALVTTVEGDECVVGLPSDHEGFGPSSVSSNSQRPSRVATPFGFRTPVTMDSPLLSGPVIARPPTYDHSGSPTTHLSPDHTPGFMGWEWAPGVPQRRREEVVRSPVVMARQGRRYALRSEK